MRNNFLIFFIVLLFTPNESFCRDSINRIKLKDIKEYPLVSIKQHLVIEENDTIYLCIYLRSLPKQAYDEFIIKIKKEGIKVLWSDYSDEVENPLISIELTIKQFRQIFNGIIECRSVPASSFDGYLQEMYVESYIIPAKYKNIIESITTPDPQTGDC